MPDSSSPSRLDQLLGTEIPLPAWFPTGTGVVTIVIGSIAVSCICQSADALITLDMRRAGTYLLVGMAATWWTLRRATRGLGPQRMWRRIMSGVMWLVPAMVVWVALILVLYNSFGRANGWVYQTPTRQVKVMVSRGVVVVDSYTFDAPLVIFGPTWTYMPPRDQAAVDLSTALKTLGFGSMRSTGPAQLSPPIGYTLFSYMSPTPLLLLVTSILPMLWLMALRRVIRSQRRMQRGFCVGCGYDLCATSERCPECGMAAAVD